ncbi:MAG: PspA/IM30 family protein [Pseudomonadota bacterium]
MLKMLNTLSKAVAFSATEKAEKRHAMAILDQQVRDAASSVGSAKKAVALIKAQNQLEKARASKVTAMIADLEARAVAALNKNAEELAHEAAAAIAILEDERVASRKAQAVFGEEISRLTGTLRHAEARLRDLQRGQRVVTARDQVRNVGSRVSITGDGALTEAEDTLAKIEDRQQRTDLADAAFANLTVSDSPSAIIDRLADAGCGPANSTSADDVLARLKAHNAPQDTPSSDAA